MLKGNPKKAPLVKGVAKKSMKVKVTHLKKSNLDKLGKMSLQEKINKVGEDSSTPEEAALALKQSLSKLEHSKVWSKYNTHLKSLPDQEQEEFQNKSKVEKGMAAALFMVKANIPKFFHFNETLASSSSLDKREKWQSHKQMVERFGEEEFEYHLQSGRVEAREDPLTWGVWQYQDHGDITKRWNVSKRKEWSMGQEYAPDEQDHNEWDSLVKRDHHSLLTEARKGGKGKGKGQESLVKGQQKGKGKGKNKGQGMLALENGKVEEATEEEQWKELLSKGKKARDQASKAKDDCEASLQKADLAKRLTKPAKKDTEALLDGLAKKVGALKNVLANQGKAMPLSKAKALLVDVVSKVKEVKGETKELNQLANRAGSKASQSSKK